MNVNPTCGITGSTLVLNKNWKPISTVPVLDAVIKVFKGRAMFLHPETYVTYDFEGWISNWDDAIRTAQVAASQVVPLVGAKLMLPEIIVCSEYRGFGFTPNMSGIPKFSRENLLLRDQYVCQYCGKRFKSEDLTQEHVQPKSKGGLATWTNIVAACVECNHKKANRTPAQAKMSLIRQPFVPTFKDLRNGMSNRWKIKLGNKAPKTWEAFLSKEYWNVSLDQN